MKMTIKSILIHRALAKNKNAANGYFIEDEESLYFVSGKNRIRISEHFSKTNTTALELVETTIRFEGKDYNSELSTNSKMDVS